MKTLTITVIENQEDIIIQVARLNFHMTLLGSLLIADKRYLVDYDLKDAKSCVDFCNRNIVTPKHMKKESRSE